MIVADNYTHTHACQKYSLEKKRGTPPQQGGLNSDITWIKSKQPNKLHFHFQLTSIIKKKSSGSNDGICHRRHLPRIFWGLNILVELHRQNPSDKNLQD